jgi:hypothetical protein
LSSKPLVLLIFAEKDETNTLKVQIMFLLKILNVLLENKTVFLGNKQGFENIESNSNKTEFS